MVDKQAKIAETSHRYDNGEQVKPISNGAAEPLRNPKLYFVVKGPPFGKERPRSGKDGRHRTPIKTKNYESYVGMLARQALLRLPEKEADCFPTKKQVFMDIWIYHKNAIKPDSDNVVKAIEDGLSGVLWYNDRHVLTRPQAERWPDANPRVEIEITFTGWEIP
jgi:crossover junction endodeoxyribonuclease RusA